MKNILTLILLISPTVHAKEPVRIAIQPTVISFDPAGVQDQSSLFISRQINCQLIRQKGRVTYNDLASSVKYLTPLKIAFSLDKSRTFNDGSKVTAEDVVATFDYLIKSRRVLRNIFSWVKDFKAVGDTVEINLNQAAPQFLNQLASPNYAIFKKSFLERAAQNPSLWQYPIGCGDYRVTSNRQNEGVITLSPVGKGENLEFYFAGGTGKPADGKIVDISTMAVGDGPVDPEHRIEQVFDPYQIFLALNSDKKPWNNKANRCNFFSQLETKDILQFYSGDAEKAVDLFPRGILGYSSQWDYPDFYSAKKKGAKKVGKFEIAFLAVSIPQPARPKYVDFVKSAAANVSMQVLENAKLFGENFRKSGADGIIMGLKSNYLDGYEYLLLFNEESANVVGKIGQKFSKAIDASQDIAESQQKALTYQQVSKEVRDECLIYPILTIPYKKIAIRQGLKTPGLGEVPINDYQLSRIQR